ncbi:TRAP transporter substrate-binding protein [Bacillus dakarensis]|uniref:TRAP transporter substrate-binding protein n=1 Tax=Robertmurraya dakarensis TaxID=1926278 RepID=UPI000981D8A8|nr:TRAP transporter substrate-binding protein [Bacillus dakarensis]
MNTNRFLKLSLALVFMLSLLLLGACSSGSSRSESTGGSSDEGKAEEKEEKIYKLRMNSMNAPPTDSNTSSYLAQEGFKELVKEKTNGRVEIEIFYANQLAGQSESLDALSRGTIDMQVISPVSWTDKIPEGNWNSLPFGWKNEEELVYLINESGLGDLYAEALNEYGVKPLFYYQSSAMAFLSNVRISGPEDMKGAIVNTQGTLKGDFYKAMGAGIANLPYAEYYEGLLRGTIDAVSFPAYTLDTYKLGEVVKYVTVPGELSPGAAMIAISQSAWDELPSDLQDLVMEAAKEIEQQTIAASKAYTEHGIEFAKENGLEVVELSEEAHKEFVEIAKETYWRGFAETNERTKKMIEIIEETQNN